MEEETQRLVEAFVEKEQIEGYLANLEKLRADGSITEEQYSTTSKEYHRKLGAVVSEIAGIKNRLKENLKSNQCDTEARREEIRNLEVRQKVGELSPEEYRKSEQKLRAEIEKLEQYSDKLKLFIEADPSAATGSVPAKRPEVAAPEITSPVEVAVSERTESPVRKVKSGRGRMLAIIGGVIGIIAVVIVAFVLLTSGDKGKSVLPSAGDEDIDVAVPVNIRSAKDIGGLQFELLYDAGRLTAVEVESGTMVGDAILEYSIDVPGRIIVGIISNKAINGDGPVAVVAFMIKGEGETTVLLALETLAVYNESDMAEIPATASDGSYKAKDGSYVAPALVFGSEADE